MAPRDYRKATRGMLARLAQSKELAGVAGVVACAGGSV
jgi:hypothetical protein